MAGLLPIRDLNLRVVLENAVSLAILQAVVYLLPALMLYYLTEVVGMVYLSRIAFVTAFAHIGVAVVDFGFKLSGTREVAASRSDPARLARVYSSIQAVKALLAAAVMAVSLLLVLAVPTFRENALLVVFSFGAILGDVLIPVWFFQGLEKMKFMTVLNTLTHVVFFGLVLLLVREPEHYVYVPLLNSAGYVLSGAVCMVLIRRRFRVRMVAVTAAEMGAALRGSWRVFVTGFLPNLYNDATEVVLQLVTGNRSPVLGWFSLAKKFIDVFNSVVYVISQAYFPLLTREPSYFKAFRRIILSWGAGLSVAAFAAAPFVVQVASGDQWAGALPLIRILALGPFAIAVVMCYGRNLLLPHRLDDVFLRTVLAVSLAGFVLGLVLVPLFEHVGASVTLSASRALYAAASFGVAVALVRRGVLTADGMPGPARAAGPASTPSREGSEPWK